MKYKIDHDYHIHSKLSRCSDDPEQTTERILEYADVNGMKSVAITDHYWDETIPGAWTWYELQNTEHVSQNLPLPEKEGIRFMFGCECEFPKEMIPAISKERFDTFDFIIVPTTHLHMKSIVSPDITDTDVRAALWTGRLEALLNCELPFHKVGIAHLTCGLIYKTDRAAFCRILNTIKDDDMERLFAKAAEIGVGIEINADCMRYDDSEAETVLRPYRIAKYQGCKFYLGSDAHHPAQLEAAPELFKRGIDALGLTEADKFYIK